MAPYRGGVGDSERGARGRTYNALKSQTSMGSELAGY